MLLSSAKKAVDLILKGATIPTKIELDSKSLQWYLYITNYTVDELSTVYKLEEVNKIRFFNDYEGILKSISILSHHNKVLTINSGSHSTTIFKDFDSANNFNEASQTDNINLYDYVVAYSIQYDCWTLCRIIGYNVSLTDIIDPSRTNGSIGHVYLKSGLSYSFKAVRQSQLQLVIFRNGVSVYHSDIAWSNNELSTKIDLLKEGINFLNTK